jgi:hypothetical protein
MAFQKLTKLFLIRKFAVMLGLIGNVPRRGYRILAQGFNPGNRPPGRRALTRNMVELRVTLAVEIGR